MEFEKSKSLKSRHQKIDFEMYVYIGFGHNIKASLFLYEL